MMNGRLARSPFLPGWLVCACLAAGGCLNQTPPPPTVPHELAMSPLPPYVIEPPDILLIDAIRLVPRPPYLIAPLDSILIQTINIPPEEPIQGLYAVAPDGTVNLGFSHGSVKVTGMTLEQAQAAIEKQLKLSRLKNPQVRVSLGQMGGIQLIRGDHLVRPDGTIGLGIYGSLQVGGLTLDQARWVIQQFLSRFFVDPEISLDVYAYNSKYYYVIADGAGYGQQILRFPVTGKETVLDAISQIWGLPLVSSKYRIWVSRPDASKPCGQNVLPVDWVCLTEGGSSATNYQLLPGDRVFIQSQELIRTNNALAKAFAPIERIFGLTLLGATTVQSIQQIGVLSRTGSATGVVTSGGTIVGTNR